ncbi:MULTISPECIES: hypothetical protein [unclassified Bradyrhizobium]|uniref:hypothetical protein n=1 Tax=Bradyrhizobium sp. BRP56 TaxID=2793819 RepID=UPI001CD4D3CD|nr:hypothetical protein [Bradyrhizobium sp. BRP56]MCA1394815.1 hypothetical protein [Bradyrhizobium sp. BRP56]
MDGILSGVMPAHAGIQCAVTSRLKQDRSGILVTSLPADDTEQAPRHCAASRAAAQQSK